jgi:hypothetical protein
MLVAPQITGDTMSITAGITFHSVKKISAHSPSTIGAPLILSLTGHEFPTCGSITIFLEDQELVDRLVEAINGAVEHKCEPDLAHQEAHDAAAYAYRGSHR